MIRTFQLNSMISQNPKVKAKNSRFPGSCKIPFPVKIFYVFPNPAPYSDEIPDPENTLPDPIKNVSKSAFWSPFRPFSFKTRLLLVRVILAVVGHFNSCTEFHFKPCDTGNMTYIRKTRLTIKQKRSFWDLPSDKNSMQLEWYTLLLLFIIITITFAECYGPINFNSTSREMPVTFIKLKSKT